MLSNLCKHTHVHVQGIRVVRNKQLLHSDYIQKGDLDLTKGFSFSVPLVAFIIGIFCNILGIGGGELVGPLLLVLQLDPQVSSATSSILSLLSSSSNVVHYGVDGEIPLRTAAWVFPVGVFGMYIDIYPYEYLYVCL